MRYTTYFVCSLDQLSDERHADTHTQHHTICHSQSCLLRPRLPRAPSSTMQKGATDRNPNSQGAASSRHCSRWTHALPPCCTGTRQSTSHQPRLQARHEPHHNRGRQNPPNPGATAPRLPARAIRIGPRAQGTSAASTRAHRTRPVPPWPPGKRPWPCQRPTARRHISRATRSHPTIHGCPDACGSSRIGWFRKHISNRTRSAAICT